MKKNIILVCFSLIVSCSLFLTSAAENDLLKLSDYILKRSDICEKGDINNDGLINVFDVMTLRRSMMQQNSGILRTIYVSDTPELLSAMQNAQAGDEIVIRSGLYESDKTGTKASLFRSSAEGTKENPIILRSENADDKAIISGTDPAVGIVLYITGDNWIINDVCVQKAQKGIVLDNSNYSIIKNCDVSNIGSEGIHLRDNSSYCVIDGCRVTNTGTVSAGYGEAVYIGSAKSTTAYGYSCNYNKVVNCTLGPGVTAEMVDIKEMTTGNIVESCIMYGDNISGAVSATSILNAKGNDAVIRNNIVYRNGNSIVRNAFEVHQQVEEWGINNDFYNNTCYLDESDAYVLRVYSGSAKASGNMRMPDGNMYNSYGTGSLTEY